MQARSTSARVPRARSLSRTSSARSMRTRSTTRRMNRNRIRRRLLLLRRKHRHRRRLRTRHLYRQRSRRKLFQPPRPRRSPSRKRFGSPRRPLPRRSCNNPCSLPRKRLRRSRLHLGKPPRTPHPQAARDTDARTAMKSGCKARHAQPWRLARRPKRSSIR